MRPVWKILIAALVVIGLVAALLAIPHFHATSALTAYRAQLKAQGEKMTVAELTPQLSEEALKNGRELSAAVSTLSLLTNNPRMMRWISPGHAVVGWAEEISPNYASTNCWPAVEAALKKHPDELASIRAVLARPRIGFAADYQHGFRGLTLTHLGDLGKAGIWLSVAGTVVMHERDTAEAWSNLESGLDLVRIFGAEPSLVARLNQFAMISLECAQTWEVLQYSGWSDAQLAQLQQGWDSFSVLDGLEAAISLNRLMDGPSFDMTRGSYGIYAAMFASASTPGSAPQTYNTLGEILANPLAGAKAHLRYRSWKVVISYQVELCFAQVWQAAIEAVRLARANDAFLPALKSYQEAETNILSGYPQSDPRFAVMYQQIGGLLPGFLLQAADAETVRRMVVTAIALERYRLQHKEYPAQLSDLTPELLPKVPVDFMDGKPLRYRRRDDGTYLLYSVGEDGKDDGGDGSPPPNYQPDVEAWYNYVYAFKTWYKMRDAVWPMPATPDEVKKYEADALQKLSQPPPAKPVPQLVPESNSTNSNAN